MVSMYMFKHVSAWISNSLSVSQSVFWLCILLHSILFVKTRVIEKLVEHKAEIKFLTKQNINT